MSRGNKEKKAPYNPNPPRHCGQGQRKGATYTIADELGTRRMPTQEEVQEAANFVDAFIPDEKN